MRNAKHIAKKTLAVFSTAALLLSCGTTGVVTGFTSAGIVANAASTAVATQLRIYDANGNDISDNPIIYLDTSEAAGEDSVYHNVRKTIKVVASNDNGVAVKDEIRFFGEAGATDNIGVICPESGTEKITATIFGGYWETNDSGKKEWKAKKSGTTHLYFTTKSGEVYRSVTVITYNPATDMKVYINSKKNQLDLNDYNLANACSVMAIANHKYQFLADKVPTNSTDEFEWHVYEGDYNGEEDVTPKATRKAEITSSGLFTPKSNGTVTIVAKYKATETTPRDYNLGDKITMGRDEQGKAKVVTLTNYKNVPKYIHVTIVKENPAKKLKITNAPSAMEIGDTFQFKYNATPTYTGTGYETGATDTFTWKSSNPQVATVDEKGLVTAVGKGDTKITIFAENENVFAEVDLKVLTKATSISFPVKTISTRVGVSTTLKAIMAPVTADEEIVWSSSDTSIATVKSGVTGEFTNEQTGIITGVKTGTVIITAKAKNSGVEAKITCNVAKKIDSTDIKLSTQDGNEIIEIFNGSVISVFDQKKITINGSLVAADGTAPDDYLNWKVLGNGENNGDYVTIDSQTKDSITLTGFARGQVTVQAISNANPNLKKSFTLKVLKKATKGKIIDNATGSSTFHKYMNVGTTMSLGGDITIESNQPYDHDDTVKYWKSSNEDVFKIDNSGNLKAVGNGSSVITMYTASGYSLSSSLTAFTTSSVMIKNVTIQAGGDLPRAEVALGRDNTASKVLTAAVKNERDVAVTDVALTWSIDNEDVATIDDNGKITARSIGQAIVTVKSGNKSDSCILYVTYPMSNSNVSMGNVLYSPYVTSYEPEVSVYSSTGVLLERDVDYTLEYTNNTTVGQTATVTATGIGFYTGTISRTFRIMPRPMNDPEVTVDAIANQKLTANNKVSGITPTVHVVQLGSPLVKDVDYTVTYANNKAVGEGIVTITGKGNYTGKAIAYFSIYCNHDGTKTETVKKKATCVETGLASVKCDICGNTTDKVLSLVEHTFVKTKTVAPTYTEDGYTLYTCSVCKETEERDPVAALERVEIRFCNIELDKTHFTANGTAQVPKMKLSYKGKQLVENTDYTLSYSNKDSKAAGVYTIKVVGKNGFKGTLSYAYDILPVASTISLNKTSATLTADEIITLIPTTGPEDAVSTLKWTSSNATVAKVDAKGNVTALKAGTATITAASGTAKATCTITVKAAAFHNISAISADTVKLGESVKVFCNAESATAPYQYAVFYKVTGTTTWTCIQSFKANTTVSVTPKRAVSYDIRVKAKDASGKVANKDFSVDVVKALTNDSFISADSAVQGRSIFVKGVASGGTAPYEFAVFYKRTDSSSWTCVQKYGSNQGVEVTPKTATTYNVRVKAKDADGTVKDKNFKITITAPAALKNTSTLSKTTITKGQSVTVNASATGGTAPYQYAVYYKKSTTSAWSTARGFAIGTSIPVTPKNSGTYNICVKVKDAKGKVTKKTLNVNVQPDFTNTSTISATTITKGSTVTVKASASGGTAPYQYAVWYKRSSVSKWQKGQDYSTNTTVRIKPNYATKYTVRVNAKDQKGNVVKKDFTVTVKAAT